MGNNSALYGLLFVICLVQCVSGENDPDAFLEEASQIYSSILHKYNQKVRPPDSWPNKVPVGLSGKLWHIRDVNLMNQEMVSLIELEIGWRDKRLAWYPYKVNQISTNITTVWAPEMIYSNAALPPKTMLSPKVVITSEGHIRWKRREIVTTLCRTKPSSRNQTCSINMKFVSPGNQEYFKNSTTFSLSDSFNNHRWNVESAELQFKDDNQTEIIFSMNLIQKNSYKFENSMALSDRDTKCSGSITKCSITNTLVVLLIIHILCKISQ